MKQFNFVTHQPNLATILYEFFNNLDTYRHLNIVKVFPSPHSNFNLFYIIFENRDENRNIDFEHIAAFFHNVSSPYENQLPQPN